MAKTQLKMGSHSVLLGQQAVEVWYGGELVASVYGSDGPGVRVLSKYPMDVVRGGFE